MRLHTGRVARVGPTSADDSAIAQALLQARRTGRLADARRVDVADAAQAYRVQEHVAQAMGWFDDAPPRHWKSGGPGRDATLTHAPLPPAGVWTSPADARNWPFHWRGIEAEIALRLGQPVNPAQAQPLTPPQANVLVDAMAVAIEIVDFRWVQAQDASAWHKLADLQSHGALVLGEWQPRRAVDWAVQRVALHIGAKEQSFQGTHPLADPNWLLPAWLRHATRHGAVLPAGTVVTTGSWCGMPMVQAGDVVRVRFEGIGEARVRL